MIYSFDRHEILTSPPRYNHLNDLTAIAVVPSVRPSAQGIGTVHPIGRRRGALLGPASLHGGRGPLRHVAAPTRPRSRYYLGVFF